MRTAGDQPPRNRDQELPSRPGESIDDGPDGTPDVDDTPDTPPTEPAPVPVEEPPPSPDHERGPFIVGPY
jgi:hypothetical protein